jgi:hypothetical protein
MSAASDLDRRDSPPPPPEVVDDDDDEELLLLRASPEEFEDGRGRCDLDAAADEAANGMGTGRMRCDAMRCEAAVACSGCSATLNSAYRASSVDNGGTIAWGYLSLYQQRTWLADHRID